MPPVSGVPSTGASASRTVSPRTLDEVDALLARTPQPGQMTLANALGADPALAPLGAAKLRTLGAILAQRTPARQVINSFAASNGRYAPSGETGDALSGLRGRAAPTVAEAEAILARDPWAAAEARFTGKSLAGLAAELLDENNEDTRLGERMVQYFYASAHVDLPALVKDGAAPVTTRSGAAQANARTALVTLQQIVGGAGGLGGDAAIVKSAVRGVRLEAGAHPTIAVLIDGPPSHLGADYRSVVDARHAKFLAVSAAVKRIVGDDFVGVRVDQGGWRT